jgi:hypothetical protein
MKQDDCFYDTRYLSHFKLLINGLQPVDNASSVSISPIPTSISKSIILQKNLLHAARGSRGMHQHPEPRRRTKPCEADRLGK